MKVAKKDMKKGAKKMERLHSEHEKHLHEKPKAMKKMGNKDTKY